MTTRQPRLELAPCEGTTRADQPHFLRLVAANGETLQHSEPYATRSNARRAARAHLRVMAVVAAGTVVEVQA